MSSPEEREFHVDMSFSAVDTHKRFLIASIVAVCTILFIVLTMTTSLATHLLPMEDQYLQILVPVASDGSEPMGLTALDQEIKENTMTVKGSVENRTDYALSGVMAVVDMQETTTRFPVTVQVPIDPPELAPKQVGTFVASATMQQHPAGYLLKFRLSGDGPFIAHKDERPTLGITPTITIPQPK